MISRLGTGRLGADQVFGPVFSTGEFCPPRREENVIAMVHKAPNESVQRDREEHDGQPPTFGQGVPQAQLSERDPAPVSTDRLHFLHGDGSKTCYERDNPCGATDELFLPLDRQVGQIYHASDCQKSHQHDGQDVKINRLRSHLGKKAVGCTSRA